MRTLPAIVLLLAASPALGQSFDICTAADSSGTEATEDRILLCDKTSDVPISVTLGSIRPPASETVAGICELSTSAETAAGLCVQASDTRLSDPRTPSGAASGDLSGTYPSPALAVDTVGLDELAACAGPGEIVEYGGAGVPACIATPGGGSSIILDLGDDAANESTALGEIATTSTPAGMFTEPAPDKLLVDGAIPWTAATKIDADGDGTAEAGLSAGALLIDSNDDATTDASIDSGGIDLPSGLGTAPAIRMGAAETGWYESAGAIRPTHAGVWSGVEITSTYTGFNFARVYYGGLSSTTAVFAPWGAVSGQGSGLGQTSGTEVVLIAGGVTTLATSHDGTRALTTITDLLRLHNASTPPDTCAAGLAGALYYDTTTPAVCICNSAAWTPMWPAGGDCT